MMYVLFIIAVCLLTAGHFFRMLRWRQFIAIYEQPNPARLLYALIWGYAVSFFIPFRAGDAVRAVLSGRRLKNGVPFSLATIILEYLMDIPFVGIIFLLIALYTSGAETFRYAALYGLLSASVFICSAAAVRFSGYVKAAAKTVSSVFNQSIKYMLLIFFWGLITAFKDIFTKISKLKLFLYTISMWLIYLLSYACLARSAFLAGIGMNFTTVFTTLFSQGGFSVAHLIAEPGTSLPGGMQAAQLLSAYIVAQFVLLPVISLILRRMAFARGGADDGTGQVAVKNINLLPYVNEKDRLRFLESYFSSAGSGDLIRHMEANRDIFILQDYSTGSNATTMLCMDAACSFYRKYAVGSAGDKLYEQVQWIKAHEGVLPVPSIIRQQYDSGYCLYDMEYNAAAIGLFNYIHSASVESSWGIIEKALDSLREGLHTMNARPADIGLIEQYIERKVYANLNAIESAKGFRKLLEYDTLVINGELYRNISHLKQWLVRPYLAKVFKNDACADIHGDFTVENLICHEANQSCPFYFIDPNTGNIHDSPALDYAKLLQSFHGGYEFLMHTEQVKVWDNNIQFVASSSKQYADIFSKYNGYLQKRFDIAQMRSIYFHEVVHWLRLLPYKIENDADRAALFYAGLIKVFSDAVAWYGGDLV